MAETAPETIIVIGAGHGAAQCVESLRSAGFGGALIMIGDEAHRPYDRPATSKELLSGGIELDRVFLKRDQFYSDKNIDLRLGVSVTAIDRADHRITLSTGEALGYDKLVIATGARARKLQIPGCDLAIIGGGYVGLEVAASATKLGCKVTVIEVLERLLARVAGPEIAKFYEDAHRAAGVELRFGTGIESFTGEGSVKAVRLADGTEIAADAVVVGIGAIPNTELAVAAGLAVDNGIVVDECGRTSDPDIFAIGDVTNHPNDILGKRLRLESVPAAMGQARAAASAIAGTPKPFHELPWFWSDQYDLKLQIAGMSQPGDQVVVRGDPADRRFAAYYLRDGKIVAVNAINSARDFMGAKKLILEGRKPDLAKLADLAVPLAEV